MRLGTRPFLVWAWLHVHLRSEEVSAQNLGWGREVTLTKWHYWLCQESDLTGRHGDGLGLNLPKKILISNPQHTSRSERHSSDITDITDV